MDSQSPSTKLTKTPVYLFLCGVKASFKLVESALLIGAIALIAGINRPRQRAWAAALGSGYRECLKPRSSVNKLVYRKYIIGTLVANPSTMAGTTNIAACVKIIVAKPALLNPTNLMTPISNVLVSTDMRRSE